MICLRIFLSLFFHLAIRYVLYNHLDLLIFTCALNKTVWDLLQFFTASMTQTPQRFTKPVTDSDSKAVLPEPEPTFTKSPNADQQAAYDSKMQERAVLIQQRKNNQNTVWFHMALVLKNTILKSKLTNAWDPIDIPTSQ